MPKKGSGFQVMTIRKKVYAKAKKLQEKLNSGVKYSKIKVSMTDIASIALLEYLEAHKDASTVQLRNEIFRGMDNAKLIGE